MSLSIDSRLVCGLYAFGHWFECELGSVVVDAYEFVSHHEAFAVGESDYDREATVYQMADAYPDLPNDNGCGGFGPTPARPTPALVPVTRSGSRKWERVIWSASPCWR
jgi:hypothetical protein